MFFGTYLSKTKTKNIFLKKKKNRKIFFEKKKKTKNVVRKIFFDFFFPKNNVIYWEARLVPSSAINIPLLDCFSKNMFRKIFFEK